MPDRRTISAALVALAGGIGVGILDSSPGWDDTGITAVFLIAAAASAAFIERRLAWLWVGLVGLWVPLFEIPVTATLVPLVAFAFSGAGALAGYVLSRLARA